MVLITAQSVTISPADGGKCPPPVQRLVQHTTLPAGKPQACIYGTVASVTGNTIAVNGTDPTGKTTHTNCERHRHDHLHQARGHQYPSDPAG